VPPRSQRREDPAAPPVPPPTRCQPSQRVERGLHAPPESPQTHPRDTHPNLSSGVGHRPQPSHQLARTPHGVARRAYNSCSLVLTAHPPTLWGVPQLPHNAVQGAHPSLWQVAAVGLRQRGGACGAVHTIVCAHTVQQHQPRVCARLHRSPPPQPSSQLTAARCEDRRGGNETLATATHAGAPARRGRGRRHLRM
jgi:hypothetical protein